MAYASKYYDPVKAHEYYEKYRKKGLLKGRGTRSAEETKRRSTASLSDAGKDVAAIVKAQITAEYKAALKGVKRGDKAKRAALKAMYEEKYLQELDKIKGDASYLKPQKVKSTGSSRKSSEDREREERNRERERQQEEKRKAEEQKKQKQRKAAIKKLKGEINNLQALINDLPQEKRKQIYPTIEKMLKRLKALRK